MDRSVARKMKKSSYPEYNVWKKMRDRCNNERSDSFQWYGAKGIKICPEWDDFLKFIEDVGRRPTNKHTIDRINNALGYFPGNCRWATMKEQNANRSVTRLIEINGETKPIAVWAESYGKEKSVVYRRLKRGLNLQQALIAAPHRPPSDDMSMFFKDVGVTLPALNKTEKNN